jgi:hypothetical protein
MTVSIGQAQAGSVLMDAALSDQDYRPSATTQKQESASEPLTASSPPSDGPSPPVTSPACPTATCPPPPTCAADTELASCFANQLAAEEARQAEHHLYQQERQRLSTWQDQNRAVMQQNNAQAANIRRQRIALAHRYQLVLLNDPVCLSPSQLRSDRADSRCST